MKWDDLASFYDSKQWQNSDRGYGSDTAMRAYGVIQENEKKIKQAFKNGETSVIHVSNKKVEAAVKGILEDQGLSVFDMY